MKCDHLRLWILPLLVAIAPSLASAGNQRPSKKNPNTPSANVVPGEKVPETGVVELYSDRYGGTGIGGGAGARSLGNRGSARGAFLPFGNLFIKGFGLSTLYEAAIENPRPTGKLGKAGPGRVKPSSIFDILGPRRFATIKAVHEDNARVAYWNPELLRKLGFDVPPGNIMTPEFEKHLVDVLAYRALRPAIDMDKVDHDDPWHATGVEVMQDATIEARAGELAQNLLSNGSPRTAVIFTTGRFTDSHDERGMIPETLSVRTGIDTGGRSAELRAPIRPAHFVENRTAERFDIGKWSAPTFIRAMEDAGELVTRPDAKGKPVADLKRTMMREIDLEAETTAESVRWRAQHGGISTSNGAIGGSWNDFNTFSTQHRTARTTIAPGEEDSRYGYEHEDRGSELQWVYDALVKKMTRAQRATYHAEPLDAVGFMDKRYRFHLRNQMLRAVGMKPSLAADVAHSDPAAVHQYFETVQEMMALTNPTDWHGLWAGQKDVSDLSVINVFNLLKSYPKAYFAGGDHAAEIRKLVDLRFSGDEGSRRELSQKVDELLVRFAADYDAVMKSATKLAPNHYDSIADFQKAVAQRAEFENRDIPLFVRGHHLAENRKAVDEYKRTSSPDVLRKIIDKDVASSMRNVENILRTGQLRSLPDGSVELQQRTIDGIDYSLRAQDDDKQTRELHVSIPVTKSGDQYVLRLRDRPSLSMDALKKLSYRYSTSEWKTQADAPVTIHTVDGEMRAEFVIPAEKATQGHLEGALHDAHGDRWFKDGSANYTGYVFAVPDRHDLRQLITESKAAATEAHAEVATKE